MGYRRFGRLRCELLTLYNHVGEDGDGCAMWQATRLEGVAAFRRGGARQDGRGGVRGDERAVLYLFADGMRGGPKGYVPPGEFEAMGAAARARVWTIREDGRDRLCFGQMAGDAPPAGGGVYRPMWVKRCEKGSGRMWHLQVGCV